MFTDPAPSLPLLTHLTRLDDTVWLRESLTTFAESVASFLPGCLPAYTRLSHVIGGDDGVSNAQAPAEGILPLALIEVLLEHLRPATTTPETCCFAVWEGFGDSVVPTTLVPKLELPNRAYHVFTGPLAAARTSFAMAPWSHQSANLFWPADHAWCVATEVDLAWTFVGAPRSCIEALLTDPRLHARATTPAARSGNW